MIFIARLASRGSAARRARIWQMGFAGLMLLPILLCSLQPVKFIRTAAQLAPVVPSTAPPGPQPYALRADTGSSPTLAHEPRPTSPGSSAESASTLRSEAPVTALRGAVQSAHLSFPPIPLMLGSLWILGAALSILSLLAGAAGMRRLARCCEFSR